MAERKRGSLGCLRGPVEKVEKGRREGEINRKKGRNAKGGKKEERAEERRKQNGIAA